MKAKNRHIVLTNERSGFPRIRSSSRSMARRVGRWQLKPIAESTRET